jgi:hypothetical protein
VAVPDPRLEGGPPQPVVRAGHRLLGLFGAAFLILLVITGVAVQHPNALGLDQRYVQSPSLLAWYGISPPEVSSMYVDQDIAYAQLDERTYRGQQQLVEVEGELRGVKTITGVSLVATTRGVWLYDADARFVDRFDPPGIPLRLGNSGEAALLETDQGTFLADADFLSWSLRSLRSEADAPLANWAIAQPPTQEHRRAFQRLYLDKVVSWERLLIDLHSGRIFGWLGPYVIDTAALGLLIVAITGLLLAARPKRPPGTD